VLEGGGDRREPRVATHSCRGTSEGRRHGAGARARFHGGKRELEDWFLKRKMTRGFLENDGSGEVECKKAKRELVGC
jgi:hypothetical protein